MQEERIQSNHGYTLQENEISKHSAITANTSLSQQSDVTPVTQPQGLDSAWKVEFNPDTRTALKLNLVHTVTQNTIRTYAVLSMDGEYLATVSYWHSAHL